MYRPGRAVTIDAGWVFRWIGIALLPAITVALVMDGRSSTVHSAAMIAVSLGAALLVARGDHRTSIAGAGVCAVLGIATYPFGGLAYLMPGTLFVVAAADARLPTWGLLPVRVVVIGLTLLWPLTWIGIGLLLTPVMIPLFVWAVTPRRGREGEGLRQLPRTRIGERP